MGFFDKYDFFCFQLFGTDVTFILDENFLNNKYISSVHFLHYHETWELYCILNGNIGIQTKSGTFALGEKQFMLIPPYTEHCIVSHDEGTTHLSIRIYVSTENKSNNCINRLLNSMPLIPMELQDAAINDLQQIQKYYMELKTSDRNNIWYNPKISSCSMHFFTEILSFLDYAELDIPRKDTNSQKFFHPMLIEVLMACDSESKLSISALPKT